jgi:colicin import membrane protein
METSRTNAFFLSATLHVMVVVALALFAFVFKERPAPTMKFFELVAGEGDNYGAKVAPKLGTPGGIKVDIPATPEIRPEPVKPEPAPLTPAPPTTPAPEPKLTPAPVPAPKLTPAPTKAQIPPPTTPNFKKQMERQINRAKDKAKKEIEKERAAEAKRLADEAKKMTKAEFDKKNKQVADAKLPPGKIQKVDVDGITKGVPGGSTENRDGGAGGKALRSENDDLLQNYYALFKQRLRREFEPPPGLADSLKATVEFRSNANGSLTNPRITKSSGNREFDAALLAALRRVSMPERPDRRAETIEFEFALREREEN